MLEVTGLGDRLKEARKAKGFTLDDLQEITKIQKRYLLGIENEEYNTMPGSFYVRAFIKQYAEAVDLDADEMLSLYKGSAETVEAVEEEERQKVAPTLTRSRSRSTNQLTQVMPKIIVALFIIVIILVVAFLWKHNAGNKEEGPLAPNDQIQIDQTKPKEKPSTSPTKDEEEDGAVDETDSDGEEQSDEEDNSQVLEHVQVSGQDAMYVLKDSDQFKLEIRTTGPSWIGVTDENQQELTTEARTMEAGESVEIDAKDKEKVRIRVGRTAETEIYVNGELLEYASDSITQNIHIEFEKK